MVVVVVVVGLLALIASFGVTLFTLGDIPAYIVAVALAAIVVVALLRFRQFLGRIVLVMALIFVGTLAYGGYSAYQVVRALTDNSGPVDAADPVQLAAANAKIDAARGTSGWRVELAATELTAVLQDALASNPDNPLRSATLTVIDGKAGEQGRIEFDGRFKNGSVHAKGSIEAEVEAGRITFSVRSVDLGNFTMPGLARGALNDLVETITDLNDRLDEQNADVQSLTIGQGVIVISGVQGNGELVTLASVLDSVKENVAALGAKTEPPVETIGVGNANALTVDGSPYYVALGDSLAANVGVGTAAEGYVSRFLKVVEARAQAQYGLRNFGVSGETSSGLLNRQLDDAIDFMDGREIAYVTIDIGANDLLGHLYSTDCSETLDTPGCQARLESAIAAYTGNLDTILQRTKRAAPKAKIIFLGMYNPFSLGFGADVRIEGQTDAIVERVNTVAADAAARHGATFADGQAAIKGRSGAVTHMLDEPPDIHPRAIGYDLLAQALSAALE